MGRREEKRRKTTPGVRKERSAFHRTRSLTRGGQTGTRGKVEIGVGKKIREAGRPKGHQKQCQSGASEEKRGGQVNRRARPGWEKRNSKKDNKGKAKLAKALPQGKEGGHHHQAKGVGKRQCPFYAEGARDGRRSNEREKGLEGSGKRSIDEPKGGGKRHLARSSPPEEVRPGGTG